MADVPEKYEFKAPEGVTIEASQSEAMGTAAKEAKLSQEGAQKLFDLGHAKDLADDKRAEQVTALAKELGIEEAAAKKFLEVVKPAAKADDGKGKDSPPEKYEFKAPEGVKLDETRVKAFTDVARELKLSQAGAQKLVDLAIAHEVASAKARDEALNTQRGAWVEAIKADKEIGGANYEANVNLARKAIAKFGTPELRQILDSGWGDHPEFVRAFVKIGKALGEDTTVDGAARGAEKTREEKLYPNQGKA